MKEGVWLRGKVWLRSEREPNGWLCEYFDKDTKDETSVRTGGIGLYANYCSVNFDNLRVNRLP